MLDPEYIAVISAGVSTIVGILTANSLTVYRIKQLEKKVDKHNCLVERTTVLETEAANTKEEIKELKHMIVR
ncbi:MAG: hypothetical protein ACYCWE_20765 [Eubacteriales bacterium]